MPLIAYMYVIDLQMVRRMPLSEMILSSPMVAKARRLTGLMTNTTYTVVVVAYNNGNESVLQSKDVTTATPIAPMISELSTEIGDGEITLNWTNPSESNFSHVEIVYAPTNDADGSTSMTVRIPEADGTSGTFSATETTMITGLTNGTEYTFTITTYHSDGTSIDTPTTATPVAPMVSEISDLSTEIGNREITLSWTNPSEPNFSHVEIVYAPTSGGASMTVRIPGTDGTPGIPGATETTTITGLINYSEYTFTIMAYDSDGNSTDISTTATPVAPMVSAVSALRTQINDGEITLSWTNPSESNFSHVEIVYAPTNGGASMTVRIPGTDPGMPGATETTTITGLTNDSEYTFTVNVYDTDDRITPSTITATPRDMTPPNPVTNLLAFLSDRQQVTVSWTNPSDTDFGYANIDYGVSGTGDTTRIRMPDTGFGTPGATESVVISDLTEGADYSFTVILYDREEPANSRPSSNPISRVLLSSEANPYTIVSLAELQSIATGFSNPQITNPLSKKASLAGHYRLANSLTVGNFTSIGDATMPFRGTFDGDGYTLMDLRINGTTSGSWGLFGVVRGGTIGNLQLDNPNVTGSGNVGALVGLLTGSGTVRYSASIGGRVTGSNSNDVIGGLVGSSNGTVTNSYATASVDGLGGDDRVGGLIGVNNAMGMATNNYATDSVNGGGGNNDHVGGLAGINNGTVTNSYATGSVNGGPGNNDHIGGLAGSNNGMITNSYATGSVNGGPGNNDHVGGLVGWNHSIIRSSYATGDADGGAGNSDNNVGRLLGSHDASKGDVTHAYYYKSALVSNGTDHSNGNPLFYWQLTSGVRGNTPGFTFANWEFASTKLPAVKGTDGITLAGQPFDLTAPGTVDIPYLVRNANELQSIATGFSNAQTGTPLGLADSLTAHYRVVSYIDLSSIGNFLPIGDDSNPFSGSFDGSHNDGVEISELTINSTQDGFWGLFGTVSGTVRNVALRNISVTGSGRVGALMGKLRSGGGVVESSHATNARVTGRNTGDVIGGLIGENSGGTITNSYAENPRVDGSGGNDDVGGLVGRNIGIITSSHANGKGYGGDKDDNLGGLVGRNSGIISGSYAKTTTLEAGKNEDNVGGLVGFNSGSSAVIESSYATGKAEGAGGNDHVGGLVGIGDGVIRNNYATGEANGGSGIDYAGGLVGRDSGNGRITQNYVTGKVAGGSGNDFIGGIIGRVRVTSPTINTNYHNRDASIDNSGVGGYSNGRTLNELRRDTPSSSIYTGWSTTHWDFGNTNALPKVRFNGSLVPGQ